jgi:hypothetical protein
MASSAEHSPFEDFFDFDMEECSGGLDADTGFFEGLSSSKEMNQKNMNWNELMDLDLGVAEIVQGVW